MFKNVLYFIGSIVVFIAGMIAYGVILKVSEPSMPEAMVSKGLRYLVNVSIHIDRKKFKLDLYSDTILVKSYSAVFGRNSSSHKTFTNDDTTPIGRYQICSIDTFYKYHKLFRLNYPNQKDAAEALSMKLISKNEYDKMVTEIEIGDCPQIKDEKLIIGIHGIGKLNYIFKNLPFVYNWTNGSIAVSNEDIDELYSAIKVGTDVIIKN
ncbi:MAG: L,D-transpeptidase [Ignavibacteriales bacterium]|nr:L,D-transpeptidase [Ignavibacteriales bacterium]